MALKIIILAAGKGTRMVANLPKVLHPLGGISLLGHVLHTAKRLNPQDIFVVTSPDIPRVQESLQNEPVTWVEQKERLGTGHAVQQVLPHIESTDCVLVLYGDVPLITMETLDYLISNIPTVGVALLVAEVADPSGLGRIVRNAKGDITAIVEHKDANPDQLRLKEINTGMMAVSGQLLLDFLPTLSQNNEQGEYYLTDIISKTTASELPVVGIQAFSDHEIQGVNNRWQLARLERYYQSLMAKKYSLCGVTIKDYTRFDVRGRSVDIAPDVEIDINVILSGQVSIGTGAYIGPNVLIENCVVGEGVRIEAGSILRDSRIHSGAVIGPYAHVRGGSQVSSHACIGNFVEIKNTQIGEGAMAKHLAYLGDATIGKKANIGAGMITCNFDGHSKWATTIGDGAFVGANATLIAPIEIGQGAIVAAGSALSDSIPAKALGVARQKQRTIPNFPRRKKKIEPSP